MPHDEPAPLITIADVRAAVERLSGVAHRTPVLSAHPRPADRRHRAAQGGEPAARRLLQVPGRLQHDLRAAGGRPVQGVCTSSSGNHAQAVALSCALVGTQATVLMPTSTPAGKRAATEGYGAEVVTYDRYRQNREELAAELTERLGAIPVPPYDHPMVMAGQGTVAVELISDAGLIDALVVPVGGGGLLAGCGVAARALLPRVELIGVEPNEGDDTARSLQAGERVHIPMPLHTIADGQQAEAPGRLTFEVNRRQVDEILLVSDQDIVATMALLFERLKIVVEPSGASALAGVLTHPDRFRGKRVGVVLSGGNIDVPRFNALMADCPAEISAWKAL